MAVRHLKSLSQSSPASIAAQTAPKFSLKDAGSGGLSPASVLFGVAGNDDLHVSIDVSDPAASLPWLDSFIGGSTTPHEDYPKSLALDVENNILFVVATGYEHFVSYDVSDPTNWQLLDYINFDTTSYSDLYCVALDTERQIAFIFGKYRMFAVDISDPNNMVELGRMTPENRDLNLQYGVLDLTTNVAYAVDMGFDSLVSFDISDPTSISVMKITASAKMGDPKHLDIDVENKIAYVVDRQTDYILMFDISNPSSTNEIGSLFTQYTNADAPVDVKKHPSVDDVILVTANGTGFDTWLTSFDVSDPSNIQVIDEIEINDSYVLQIDPASEVAYISGNYEITVIDVSDPADMQQLLHDYDSAKYEDLDQMVLDVPGPASTHARK